MARFRIAVPGFFAQVMVLRGQTGALMGYRMKEMLFLLVAVLPAGSAEFTPHDAALSDYEYPHEVKVRNFEEQSLDHSMAYMDVSPEKPNDRSVILFHGKNFSGAYWEDTVEALSQKGYRLIVPDQIGFGKSSKPVNFQYSFQALATHNAELLDMLDIGKVSVVGHSMGGMLAVRFALMFPERVERLVLVNPIGLEDWKRKVPYQSVDEGVAEEMKKTPESIREYMKQAYFDGEWKPDYDPLLELQAGWSTGPDKERMARVGALTSDMVFTQPVVHEFSDLGVPTLLIIGDRDRTAIGKNRAEPDVAETLGLYGKLGESAAAAIPDAKLVTLTGIGHLPQFEDFDAYIKALEDFLAAEE